jgi:hypothetical protein
MLKKNELAKQTAITEMQQFKEGKIDKKPVDPAVFDLIEKMILNTQGDFSKGRATVQETLMSTDVTRLIPKVIEGKMREAAEPEYLATRFFKTVQVPDGGTYSYIIPYIGEIYASEVSEGGRYNEQYADINMVERGSLEIRIKKFGIKISLTEEAITDGAWDLYSMNVAQMGRAMARCKEEQCFNEFTIHGNTIFDNAIKDQQPEAATHGLDVNGKPNDTLTMEDFLEMMLAMMGQNNTPTDVIMHPLTWVIFARNTMIGNGLTFGAFNGQQVHPWGATQGTPGFAGLNSEMGPQKFVLSPNDVQGRLPFGININFSPFIKFDKSKRTFDMYIVNANNVGVIAQKDALSTDNWTDPERDVRMLKAKERYGVGILDHGHGVAVARNLKVATTHPVPPQVEVITKNP